MTREQESTLNLSAFVNPLNKPSDRVSQNNVGTKILNDLSKINKKLNSEIVDLKKEINTKKESNEVNNNTWSKSLFNSLFSKEENETEQQITNNLEENKVNQIQEKELQIAEIDKLKDLLKDKTPKFLEGFFEEYKFGNNDILKPVEETLNQVKENTNLEINKETSLGLLTDATLLIQTLEDKQNKINKFVNNLNGKEISVKSLDKLDWEKPMENDYYNNTTSIKDLNKDRIKLYEIIAQDGNLPEKSIKAPSELKNVNDFGFENEEDKAHIKNIKEKLNQIKEQINSSSNDQSLDNITVSLSKEIGFINKAQTRLKSRENDNKQKITTAIETATNKIVNSKKVPLKSKTGEVVLNTLKAINSYDTSQKQLSKQLKDPIKNGVNSTKKDISYYFMEGAGKEKGIVNENKILLNINQNKKNITKNKVQITSAYDNLKAAHVGLNKKISNSKTINGNRKKNLDVKKKAIGVSAGFDISMEKIKEKSSILEAINPKQKKPWIISEKSNSQLSSFENAVKTMSDQVEKKAENVYKDLQKDVLTTSLTSNNLQHRSYVENGLSVNRVLSTGIIALQESNKLIADLTKVANNLDAEIETSKDNIEKVEAYFGLAEVTANLAAVATGTELGVDEIIKGIGHLSTLDSKQNLDKIKRNIDTSLKNANLRKDQLTTIVDTAKEAQSQMYAYEEVFLPQMKADEFFNENQKPGFKDKMTGVFVARDFKNSNNGITTDSKLGRDATKATINKDKALTDLVKVMGGGIKKQGLDPFKLLKNKFKTQNTKATNNQISKKTRRPSSPGL